jgi:hypothetical protein
MLVWGLGAGGGAGCMDGWAPFVVGDVHLGNWSLIFLFSKTNFDHFFSGHQNYLFIYLFTYLLIG